MRVTVLGLGVIGLPTALLMAQDHEVVGVDVDEERLAAVRSGDLGPDGGDLERLRRDVDDAFSVQSTVPDADAFVVATPTPLEPGSEVVDLQYLRAAASMIRPHLEDDDLVVLESTVPPGVSEQVLVPALASAAPGERDDADAGRGERRDDETTFDYAYCPERAIPGNTLAEMVTNDRVIGSPTAAAGRRAASLYEAFVEGDVYLTDTRCAEFTKLIENAYRDTNVALANEFARLAEEFGVDGHEAIGLANQHPRVDVLSPGPGVGGHCIGIDPLFLTQRSLDHRLISVSRDVNDAMPSYVLKTVRRHLADTSHPSLTLLGVAYKGGVGDTRESPALHFAKLARNVGYDLVAHDPYVDDCAVDLRSLPAAAEGSDCLVLLTDHEAYESLDPAALGDRMRQRTVVDTRNLIDGAAWRRHGFTVDVLGDGSTD